ncbi:MAG: HIT family protein [Bacteroidales bacterium]
MKELEMFKEKFRVNEMLIFESEHWTWSLRPLQPTLGSGILALKRYAESFSDISEEEGKDLAVIVRVIEERLKHAFAYDKINYLMLMMVDTHLHFHIIPRYSKTTEFEGITWQDKGWPGPPSLEADEVSDDVLFAIQALLK